MLLNFSLINQKLNITQIFFSIIMFSMVSGCATRSNVEYDQKTGFSFGSIKTYHLITEGQTKQDFLSLQEKRIADAINNRLKQSGFQPSTKEQADFLVSFHNVVEKNVSNRYSYHNWSYYPYRRGFYYPHYENLRQYKEGTLIIEVIDPELNQVVWSGSVSKKLPKKTTPSEKISRIQLLVERILQGFPG